MLVAASGMELDQIITAEDSPEGVVRSTSRELLRRFGGWDASALSEEQLFRFRPSADGSASCRRDLFYLYGHRGMWQGVLAVHRP